MKQPERSKDRLSKKNKHNLHKILLEIRNTGPVRRSFGICAQVYIADSYFYTEAGEKSLKRLWKTWPHFSGEDRYPVPPIKEGQTPASAFNRGVEVCNNWNKRTKYGRLRWELLDFLIDQTKPEA